jgi:mannosyltransferase OCH1-like enzyme
MTIPKVIHQYWTGSPVPDHLMQYSNAWSNLNPGWQHYLWTDASLGIDDPETGLDNASLWRRAEEFVAPGRQYQLRADIVRYELLYRFGGVWIDMDFEPLKSLNSWFAEVQGDQPFAVWEVQDKWAANGIMGAPKKHWFMKLLIDRLPASARERTGDAPTRISGPQFMTELHREQSEPMKVLGPERFYPYLWSDLNRGNIRSRPPWPAECVAVHHWNNHRNKLKVKARGRK